MSVAGWIDHQGAGAFARFLHPVDQLALLVRLAEHHLAAMSLRARLAEAADVVEGLMAVNLRFADAQEVEIGPAQHIDRFRHPAPPPAFGRLVTFARRGHKAAKVVSVKAPCV